MQVTKGTWRMREQCVPGSLSSAYAQEPGNEANQNALLTHHYPPHYKKTTTQIRFVQAVAKWHKM